MTAHDAHHIPWKELVIPQIFNFTLFVGLLVYLLRKPIKAHFSQKLESFQSLRKKAEEAKVHAERENVEVRNKIRELEVNSNKNIETAKIEAAQLKEKMLKEAQAYSERTEAEAKKMVEFEKYRVIAALRAELVLEATTQANSQIKNALDEKTQARLNQEFLNKVRVAKS